MTNKAIIARIKPLKITSEEIKFLETIFKEKDDYNALNKDAVTKGKNEDLLQIILEDYRSLKNAGYGIEIYEKIAKVVEDFFKGRYTKYPNLGILPIGTLAEPIPSACCPWQDHEQVFEHLIVTLKKDHEDIFKKLMDVTENGGIEAYKRKFKDFVKKQKIMQIGIIHPHLIKEHRYFEGKESEYRLEPLLLIKWTGIK